MQSAHLRGSRSACRASDFERKSTSAMSNPLIETVSTRVSRRCCHAWSKVTIQTASLSPLNRESLSKRNTESLRAD